MRLYSSNPYRVLGIKANANAPEKQRVKSTIAAFLKVGKAPVLDFDLCPPLDQIERTQELIDLKSNEILSDSDKLKHALFWFVSGGIIDDIALSNLTESKDFEKALVNFEKGSQGFIINENSISSIINFSSLEIITYNIHKDEIRLKMAINQKLNIVNSNQHLSLLLKLLSPDNPKASTHDISQDVIEMIKGLLKELFPDLDEEKLYLNYFSSQKDMVSGIKENINKKKIQTIKDYILICQKERARILNSNSFSGDSIFLAASAKIGKELIKNSKKLLNEIKVSYGVNSIVVANIYEDVFTEVNYCAVEASNKFQDQISNAVKVNKEKARALIIKNGESCYNEIVSLLQLASDEIHSINTPIRQNIQENLEVIKGVRDGWIGIFKTVSNGSSGEGCGESMGGCLGGIFEAFSGWIIFGIIVLLASLFGC